MSGCDDRSPAQRQDDMVQQAVLGLLIDAHPGQYSVEELVREMTGDDANEVSRRDDLERAIRDLVGAGLAHRHGPFVFASRAAVRATELES